MVVPRGNHKSFPNPQGGDKTHLFYNYYGRNHHTWKTCFKIHSRPNNGKIGRFGDRPMFTTNEVGLSSFIKEHMDHLLKLLKFNSFSNVLGTNR